MGPVATRTCAACRTKINHILGDAVVEHEPRVQEMHALYSVVASAGIVTAEVSDTSILPAHAESRCQAAGRRQSKIPDQQSHRNAHIQARAGNADRACIRARRLILGHVHFHPYDAIFSRGNIKRKSVALLIVDIIYVRDQGIRPYSGATFRIRWSSNVEIRFAIQTHLTCGNGGASRPEKRVHGC